MKPIVQYKLRQVAYFAIYCALAGAMIGLLSNLIDDQKINHNNYLLLGLLAGFILGIILGSLEEFLWRRLSQRLNLLFFNLIRISITFLIIISGLMATIAYVVYNNYDLGIGKALNIYFSEENYLRDIVFCFLFLLIIEQLHRIRRTHNQVEFLSFLSGQHFYPTEENRVVIFIDLVGSTSKAESLPPLKYSNLIKSCFYDLSEAALINKGEIYQHVGDGAIITWKVKSNKDYQQAAQCFYTYLEIIKNKRSYYLKRYGLVPSFRAGIHSGSLVRTWVGESKKELAFHGDVINTAARIQSQAKVFNRQCVASENVTTHLGAPLKITPLEEVFLSGKETKIKIAAIEI